MRNSVLLSSVAWVCLMITSSGCPGTGPDPLICDLAPATEPFTGDDTIRSVVAPHHYSDYLAVTPEGRIAIAAIDVADVNQVRLRVWDGFEWSTSVVTPPGVTRDLNTQTQVATHGDRFVVMTAYSTETEPKKFRLMLENEAGEFSEATVDGSLPTPPDFYLTRTISEPVLGRTLILFGGAVLGRAAMVELDEDGVARTSYVNTPGLEGKPLTAGYHDDLTPWILVVNQNTKKFFKVERAGTVWTDGGLVKLAYNFPTYPRAISTPFGTAGGNLVAIHYVEQPVSGWPYETRLTIRDIDTGESHLDTILAKSGDEHSYVESTYAFDEMGERLDIFARQSIDQTAIQNAWTAEGGTALSGDVPYRPNLAVLVAPTPFEACGRQLILTRNVPVGSSSQGTLRIEPRP